MRAATVTRDPALPGPARSGPALPGETLTVPERLVVAPAAGVFRPASLPDGALVEAGQAVGSVVGPGTCSPVHSPFRGTLMGMLAHDGERLRAGQAVAWLRTS